MNNHSFVDAMLKPNQGVIAIPPQVGVAISRAQKMATSQQRHKALRIAPRHDALVKQMNN